MHLNVNLLGNKVNNLVPLNVQTTLDFSFQAIGIDSFVVKKSGFVRKAFRQASTVAYNKAKYPRCFRSQPSFTKSSRIKSLNKLFVFDSSFLHQIRPTFCLHQTLKLIVKEDAMLFFPQPTLFGLRVSVESTITNQSSADGAILNIKFDGWDDNQVKFLFSYLAYHDDQEWKQNIQRAVCKNI